MNIFEELKQRQLIAQITNEEEVKNPATGDNVIVYAVIFVVALAGVVIATLNGNDNIIKNANKRSCDLLFVLLMRRLSLR
mgnify:CR=1 FL=1